jgi:hypothetical protein
VYNTPTALADWTPSQIETWRRWVEDWRRAGNALERIRRAELRSLDRGRAIELLCGSQAAPRIPREPRPTSGLIEQQRWFMRAAKRE